MNDCTCRGMNCNSHRIRYGMIYMDKLNIKASQFNVAAFFDNIKSCGMIYTMLFKFVFHKTDCQSGSVNRNIEFLQKERNTSYVVFMTVCENQTSDFIKILFKVSKIRDNKVYTKHITVRESHSAVQNNNIVVTFKNSDILSYLIKTAQKGDFNNRSILLYLLKRALFIFISFLRFILRNILKPHIPRFFHNAVTVSALYISGVSGVFLSCHTGCALFVIFTFFFNHLFLPP